MYSGQITGFGLPLVGLGPRGEEKIRLDPLPSHHPGEFLQREEGGDNLKIQLGLSREKVPGEGKEGGPEEDRQGDSSEVRKGRMKAVHAVHLPNPGARENEEKIKNSIFLKHPNGFPSHIQGNFPWTQVMDR
jgi:hypothetical protein